MTKKNKEKSSSNIKHLFGRYPLHHSNIPLTKKILPIIITYLRIIITYIGSHHNNIMQ